jgi:hypothetical protein
MSAIFLDHWRSWIEEFRNNSSIKEQNDSNGITPALKPSLLDAAGEIKDHIHSYQHVISA